MTYYNLLIPDATPPLRLYATATGPSMKSVITSLQRQAYAFFGTEQDVYMDGVINVSLEESDDPEATPQWKARADYVNEAATKDKSHSTSVTTVTKEETG